ncbi:OST-HTH/LOTUS domain-containing protein [Aromatoleum toluclasticum]|uniref:OST-HTH/LOTUS domain-containing protein n=1 Tax=Aromatoleum toluclasticum TaxID=92003 RepID=UPI001D190BB3|nr:OST-HTH/LOTUS domain-containing protein [Aromatoleum toluclasticum]MCC4118368.1 OST-HTH/LOTUS domain-containing protein [Aromatoleum toluclasticum]
MQSDIESAPSEKFISFQRDVQRKLGRCLLRLQQYEMLGKALVAEMDFGGPARQLMNIRAERAESLSKKTLGHVVGLLTDTFISTDSPESDTSTDFNEPSDITEPRIRTRFNFEIPAERLEKTRADLRALVDLRNDLVHHFLERQDVWTESGCVGALVYLDDCYAQIDERYLELHAWAKSTQEAREYMASFMQTPEFMDFLLHGILPGGAGVEWEMSTMVKLLRKAEAAFAQNGWTSLNDAIAHIQDTNPEHTPKRYGCSSWRQVLHDSKLFLIRKEQGGTGLPTKIWYRFKTQPN